MKMKKRQSKNKKNKKVQIKREKMKVEHMTK